MKLNKVSLSVLKNFASINESIYMRKGNVLLTKSLNSVIYGEATLPDVIDSDMGIYDVPEFLQTVNLFGGEFNIEVSEGDLRAKITNGKQRAGYTLVDPSVIVYPEKPANFPVADVQFQLDAKDLKTIKDSASTFGSTDIMFSSENGKIVMKSLDLKDPSANTMTIDVCDCPEENKENNFGFYMKVDNLKMEVDSYNVKITKLGAIMFETIIERDEEGQAKDKNKVQYKYIIAIEKDSYFE